MLVVVSAFAPGILRLTFGDLSGLKSDVEVCRLADGDSHLGQNSLLEVRRFDGYLIITWWHVDDVIETFVVSGCRAREVRARIASGNITVSHNRTRRVFNGTLQIGGI